MTAAREIDLAQNQVDSDRPKTVPNPSEILFLDNYIKQSDLVKKYNLVQSAVSYRIRRLKLKTIKQGNERYLVAEQVELLDALHEYLLKHPKTNIDNFLAIWNETGQTQNLVDDASAKDPPVKLVDGAKIDEQNGIIDLTDLTLYYSPYHDDHLIRLDDLQALGYQAINLESATVKNLGIVKLNKPTPIESEKKPPVVPVVEEKALIPKELEAKTGQSGWGQFFTVSLGLVTILMILINLYLIGVIPGIPFPYQP